MLTHCLSLVATAFLSVSLTVSLAADQRPVEGPIEPLLGEPRMDMQQLFKNERFPNIAVTLRGTVLATWGSTNVRVRRSEDGGKTWGDEITIASPGFQAGGTTEDEGAGDLHFEGGPGGGSQVARFNLSWLLAGEPTGDGEIPEELLK